MENVQYELGGTTTHVFPDSLRHVRIGSAGNWLEKQSHISHVDSGLYLLLGRPPVLELLNVGIETLEIPPTLRHGHFADNEIHKSWVGEDENGVEPSLVYLDLSENWMRQLPTGIERLVNLEVLNLGSNSIADIPRNTLTKLTKLWYVNLCYSNLHRFSMDQFPPSISHLELYLNNLDHLNYTELHFPAMEVLNLERNQLKQIDTSALIWTMPRLRMIRIGGNRLDEQELWDAVRVLRSHNISYRNDADDTACYYDEKIVDGVCLPESMYRKPMGTGQAVLFTVMVVMVGVVFVLVTRWVLREMKKC